MEDAAVDVGTFAVKTVGKDVIKDITDAAAINNPLVKYGAEHLVNVATGKESLEDAAVDVGTFAVKTVGKDAIKNITDTALINNPLYQSLKSGGKLGELIQVGTMVAESACRLIDGDITAEEFMLEIGDKGATMLAQMAGGEVGAIVGEIIGISVGGFLGAGAGAVIGKAIGTMIATVACNVIIAIKKNLISNSFVPDCACGAGTTTQLFHPLFYRGWVVSKHSNEHITGSQRQPLVCHLGWNQSF